MLDLPRYLLGIAELAWLASFAVLGGAAVRARLLPAFSGAPAHLATAVVALTFLIWAAEILGSFGLFEPVPYLGGVAVVGLGLWLGVGGGRGCPSRLLGFSPRETAVVRESFQGEKQDAAAPEGHPRPPSRSPSLGKDKQGASVATLVALAIAAVALVKFGLDARSKLMTGMTGFDSTWYHGPFAAGFFQSGSTWHLHFIAPQFLAWFYPANAELFHAAGMLTFGRDLLSPLLNLGWFVGCLVACWCIGRPYRVGPWSLGLGALALSLPVLADQAGEARNDIVGIFFLLAALAVAANAVGGRQNGQVGGVGVDFPSYRYGATLGPPMVVGLAAGLAAGTKLNFLLPAAVFVLGSAFIAPAGNRWRALVAAGLAALAGGGYWYLRNLIHTGNPLPWFDHLGPISLPAPEQALGGREGHSVLGYLTDGSVWSDWFLPGLHGGLTVLWPLLIALAGAGLLLSLLQWRGSLATNSVAKEPRSRFGGGGWDRLLRIASLTGFAVVIAWLVAPTSASGPDGMPRGFESGLRYLAPALVLGLALLPATPLLRRRLRHLTFTKLHLGAHSDAKRSFAGQLGPGGTWLAVASLVIAAVAVGYPVQRHYLQNRYANPTFAAPGLNAAFAWARTLDHARIATTSTRQYPLYGTDLSNHVQYIGEEQPHGGFTAPTTCPKWRRLLSAGEYDYVVTTRDRVEPGKPPYPPTTRWTEGKGATVVFREPPTVIFKLTALLDPSACPG
jgi:hypothetical protein